MEHYITAEDTVRAFCQSWFEKRDEEEAVSFLSENVVFWGPSKKEPVSGLKEMRDFIHQVIQNMEKSFACSCEVSCRQMISEQACNLSMNILLKNTLYVWNMQAFFTLVQEKGENWNIISLHFEETDGRRESQRYHKTAVEEHIAWQRQDLLNNSVSGGMMGGYIEDGFPFYFINRQMLDYLGYTDEREFIEDIGGMISNCMHPEDKEMVDAEVAFQLDQGQDYIVEYRLRKKDGSYIWVHDVGREVVAEDGRPAIVSVCLDITEQKKMRDQLLHLYNNIPGAIFFCRHDSDFTVVEANEGLFEIIEYTREEFAAMGNKLSSVIHPEDIEAIGESINGQLKSDNAAHGEKRLLCKGGRIKWVSFKLQMFKEAEGDQLSCIYIDVSDEKRQQKRKSELYEEELAYFIEMSSEEGSAQGRINVTCNRMETVIATSEMDGGNLEDSYDSIIEKLAAAAIDPDYGEKIRNTLAREKVLEDYSAGNIDYRFEFLRRRKDGSVFWSSTSFRFYLKPEANDVIAFYYTTDITAHKLQEQLLKKIAGLDYELLTEVDIRKNTYRVISFDTDRESLIAPQGEFQKEVRIVAESFMEEAVRQEYLRKLDFSYMKRQLKKEPVYSFILELQDAQGSVRTKRYQVFYVEKELGRVCIARSDVTDVVQKEQRQKERLSAALVAAEQANAAKTDFLSRMSHEIRTPMNAIIGMSTIAAQNIGDDEQVADCISKIGISSRFLLSLINDILDMSRIESGKMLLKNEKIPTDELLGEINSICYAQAISKGVEYECIVDPVLDDYYIGDSMKLQQVLLNILSNAIKFTNEGGKITFSAALRKKSKNDASLRFIINDTGVGMSEDFLPHIFEPFAQESTGSTALYGGTGLGLAISKSIVDLMDGKITVRSIKDIGTEFTVDVKLGITEEEKLRHHQKKQDYSFSHLKTLVVDDDVVVCENAVATLREMGVTAEWVDSGHKAVEQVRALWKTSKYYDMILIDWKMPDMDGIETARRIRAIVGPDVTIIIITAYDWVSIEHEAKLAGVNLLMSKPMFKSTLVSAFSRALGEKETQTPQEPQQDYDFRGKRVLLAEDNSLNTEVAVMLLESKGFEVDTAENGLRAMELFNRSQEGYYDAILMDIRMPLMDGLSATVNIRHLSNKDAKTIPIVAMTANAFDDDIEKSKAAGMDAHLAKPIDPDRLYRTLYDFIFRKES